LINYVKLKDNFIESYYVKTVQFFRISKFQLQLKNYFLQLLVQLVRKFLAVILSHHLCHHKQKNGGKVIQTMKEQLVNVMIFLELGKLHEAHNIFFHYSYYDTARLAHVKGLETA
jgi:hypothetical protein